LQTLLVGVLVSIGVLILVCLAAIVYYHKRRRPTMQRIARVRSKVYSRLYSRDKYERPVTKKDFVEMADELLSAEVVKGEDQVENDAGEELEKQQGIRQICGGYTKQVGAPTVPSAVIWKTCGVTNVLVIVGK
jgi:hypothetical protein